MFAFLVNALAVVFGAGIGLLFKKLIKKEVCDSLLKAIGIVVLLFGIAGVLRYMFKIEIDDSGEYAISTTNDLLLIITIALGMLCGELLKIDEGLKKVGDYFENKFNKSAFSEGFVSSTLVFCVGAMAVIGSVNAALGDPSIIYLKSVIDCITALVLASTLGFGVLFSSISIIIYQGLLTLIVYLAGNFISPEFVAAFSMVGYAMVACIGFNFIIPDKIKVANMLPALLFVIVYFLITNLLF